MIGDGNGAKLGDLGTGDKITIRYSIDFDLIAVKTIHRRDKKIIPAELLIFGKLVFKSAEAGVRIAETNAERDAFDVS